MTLISENHLRGPSRTPTESWAPLCGGCHLGILTKPPVEERRAGLSPAWGVGGSRFEETAGGEEGQEEGTAMSESALVEGQTVYKAKVKFVLRGCDHQGDMRGTSYLGNIFMIHLKRQGSGKATRKSKLQRAETACLCPETLSPLCSAVQPAGDS